MVQQPPGGEFVARYDQAGDLATVAQGVDQEGLDFVRVAQAPPGEGADGRAASRRGDIAGGAVTRPAIWLVGGLDAAHHDPVEQDLITPLGEQRAGPGPGRARDDGWGRDAGRQDGQAGQVRGGDPGPAAAADQGGVVGADRDGGSGRDGDGHVLEAEGDDGRGCAAVLAVDREEPGDPVDRLDRGKWPPAAQAGVDRAGSFGRAEAVTGSEHGERGARAGAELAHGPEGPGPDVGGMLRPAARAPRVRDDQRHDRGG